MKLFHNVMLHISVASAVIMAAWAVFFYWAIVDEVNDEVDDSLDDYTENLIIRVLNGEEMPSLSMVRLCLRSTMVQTISSICTM